MKLKSYKYGYKIYKVLIIFDMTSSEVKKYNWYLYQTYLYFNLKLFRILNNY